MKAFLRNSSKTKRGNTAKLKSSEDNINYIIGLQVERLITLQSNDYDIIT